jgi:hypothetical protein
MTTSSTGTEEMMGWDRLRREVVVAGIEEDNAEMWKGRPIAVEEDRYRLYEEP